MNDALGTIGPFLIGVLLTLAITYGLRSRGAQIASPNRSREPAVARQPDRQDLLDHVAEGVVLLDPNLKPVLLNRSAERLLGVQTPEMPTRLPSEEILVIAKQAMDQNLEVNQVVNLWFPFRSRLQAKAIPAGPRDGVLVILQDVTEEHRVQQVRKEFVAHASHELKSPVASLQTLAEAVRQAAPDDPEATMRFADRIVSEATRLGRLVGDLLDLSRLEDPTALPEDDVLLSDVAVRELETVVAQAAAKNMTVRNGITDDVWVRGDEQQLGLLIRNLLENAVRYTTEGGHVGIDVVTEKGAVVIRVADTGIGIPSEAQGRVFERFYRVDRARSRDRGGTGLGLAIVKHVAELHGGTVEVQSELGRGSIFTATLPSSRPPERPIASLAG